MPSYGLSASDVTSLKSKLQLLFHTDQAIANFLPKISKHWKTENLLNHAKFLRNVGSYKSYTT
jgi:hypothetical protein